MTWSITSIAGHPGCQQRFVAVCTNALGETVRAFDQGTKGWNRLMEWIEHTTSENILDAVRSKNRHSVPVGTSHRIDPFDNTVTATLSSETVNRRKVDVGGLNAESLR